MTKEPPGHLIDWKGADWTPASETTAAHPNARFTVPIDQDPAIAPEWDDPRGVPISAVLFGGRRSSVVPLVHESFTWPHGVFLGAIMTSETTAAATGEVGRLRHDPFAMLPFCGYNMADYWAHWLSFTARAEESALPKVFYVNWFRKDAEGKFLWPGFGENSRVIAWVFERCRGRGEAIRCPIGWLPAPGAIDVSGLDLRPGVIDELFSVRRGRLALRSEAHPRLLRDVRGKGPESPPRGARRARGRPRKLLSSPSSVGFEAPGQAVRNRSGSTRCRTRIGWLNLRTTTTSPREFRRRRQPDRARSRCVQWASPSSC